MIMTAMNKHVTKLASEFNTGLNMHRNLAEEATKRGTIAKITGKARYVWIENALDYPRSESQDIDAERDPRKVIDILEKNPKDFSGLIYGVDHAFRAGVDSLQHFDEFKDEFKTHLRTLHLSGSKGDHGLIEDDDYVFWDFMHSVRDKISDDVRFCIDLNPAQMDAKTPSEQVDYVKKLVQKLRRI